MILAVESKDERILERVFDILLKRYKKKIVRVKRLNKKLLTATNTAIGLERADKMKIGDDFIEFFAESRKLNNDVVYTCKNIELIPKKLKLITDIFFKFEVAPNSSST
jgi:hypothetical protein